MMKPAERQEAIVREVRKSTDERGYPPTLEELAVIFGVSRPTIRTDLQRLEARGRVTRLPHIARSIRVVEEVEDDG